LNGKTKAVVDAANTDVDATGEEGENDEAYEEGVCDAL